MHQFKAYMLIINISLGKMYQPLKLSSSHCSNLNFEYRSNTRKLLDLSEKYDANETISREEYELSQEKKRVKSNR